VNPDELRYTRSHEWVRLDGEIGTIGITDHAQKELGEIVYLELPEVGHLFKADEEFGTVESVKAVSELYIPITGEVVEINAAAVAEPGMVNEDPFGDGWLVKIRIGSNQELEALLTAAQYAEYLREEEKAR
jgi:glycine cleavage system H protein